MKKFVSLLMAVALLVTMFSVMTLSVSAEDSCGDGVYWRLDNGTMTIYGKGAMTDFSSWKKTPWYYYYPSEEYLYDHIYAVVIEDGVTKIGNNSFYGCYNLETVKIGSGVKEIGEYAFSETKLKHVYIPGNVKKLDYCAFYYCENLESAVLDEGVEEIGEYAFEYNYKLTDIWLPLTLSYGYVGYKAFAYSPLTTIYSARDRKGLCYWFHYHVDAFDGTDRKSSIVGKDAVDYEKWCSDANGHWRTDKKFQEAHVDYEKHTLDKKTGCCSACGYKLAEPCKHSSTTRKHVCNYCGGVFDSRIENGREIILFGSALSEGNLTIIVGIAAAVVFGFGGFLTAMFIFKKKKPVESVESEE